MSSSPLMPVGMRVGSSVKRVTAAPFFIQVQTLKSLLKFPIRLGTHEKRYIFAGPQGSLYGWGRMPSYSDILPTSRTASREIADLITQGCAHDGFDIPI